MRILTIDDPDDTDCPTFDCFAYINGQSYRLTVWSKLDEDHKGLLVRGLREFADYIEKSGEMKDSKIPNAHIRAMYKEGRLKGRGI